MAARWGVALAGVWLAIAATERTFEVSGQVVPEMQASVSLHGATTPFAASTLSDTRGKFRISHLAAGQYTVAAFVPGYGEKQITIDVGPSSTDEKGRYQVTIHLEQVAPDTLGGTVSTAELAIPDSARKEYANAEKRLAKHDTEGAVEHLRRAVELAPRFSAAWNHLGTIAYQTRKYPEAEQDFRKALMSDPAAFAPLVNLGGVLLSLEKIDEAYQYNLYAVLKRPQDALANSQLGMNYFFLGKMDLAEKYLIEAHRLDPGHFSHPQLLLAEIYMRKRDPQKAADQLDDFLRYHPDWPAATKIREAIANLRDR